MCILKYASLRSILTIKSPDRSKCFTKSIFSILKCILRTNSFSGLRLVTGLRSSVFLGTRKVFEKKFFRRMFDYRICTFLTYFERIYSLDLENCIDFVLNSRRYAYTVGKFQGSEVILDHSSNLVARLPTQYVLTDCFSAGCMLQ